MRSFSVLALSIFGVLSAGSAAYVGCNTSKAVMKLPTNQTLLVQPNTTAPSFIALAVGVQNYTCANTSTYTNIGALAELFDISCLYDTPLFSYVQDVAYAAWNAAPASVTAAEVISFVNGIDSSAALGQHYFTTNPVTGTGTNPKWDFSSASYSGNPDAYVVGAKTGDLAAPDGKQNIDWLQLKAIAGDLATTVYRTYTVSGQPPASCNPANTSILTVRYTSKYWLYGGSVKA